MAVAHVLERLESAQALIARLDVDLGDPLLGRDEVAAIDIDVDAADRVDRISEPREVDVDDVVDLDAGAAA